MFKKTQKIRRFCKNATHTKQIENQYLILLWENSLQSFSFSVLFLFMIVFLIHVEYLIQSYGIKNFKIFIIFLVRKWKLPQGFVNGIRISYYGYGFICTGMGD